MENVIVQPWREEELPVGTLVPDYMEQLAYQVLEFYDFSVQSMAVAATKPLKGGCIWKVETSAGPKSLKLLHRRPERSLFSLEAQEYLVHVQKARVPEIVRTKDGEKYVEAGGKLWFVAEWIEPLTPVPSDLEGAKLLCHSMGEFHQLSKGYSPPNNAEIASRLTKWPKKYTKIAMKMDWFRNIAMYYPELPASCPLVQAVNQFQEETKRSYQWLQQSAYSQLIAKGPLYWGLVHQDFGWSNSQMGPNGMWVIDLDGVAYDLPIRDLSKLISSTMTSLPKWDTRWVREMIQAYHKANPLSPELYEVLLIDLSVPNEFYKNMKDIVYDPETFLNAEMAKMIEELAVIEQSKWDVLAEIQHDWKGVS